MLVFGKKDTSYILLFLPFYPPQASRKFGSGGFMMCHALAAMPVPRAVFRTRAIYVIMRTGHGLVI